MFKFTWYSYKHASTLPRHVTNLTVRANERLTGNVFIKITASFFHYSVFLHNIFTVVCMLHMHTKWYGVVSILNLFIHFFLYQFKILNMWQLHSYETTYSCNITSDLLLLSYCFYCYLFILSSWTVLIIIIITKLYHNTGLHTIQVL